MFRRFSQLPFVLLLIAALAIAGCDSSDSDDDDDGGNEDNNGASVEVSGAISAEYTGTASFASAFGISWAVTIVLDDDKGTVVATVFGDPSRDSFQIGEGNDDGVAGVTLSLNDLAEGGNPGTVILNSGTLNLTDRDDKKLKGNFNGSGVAVFTDEAVTASGSFTATCIILCDIGD